MPTWSAKGDRIAYVSREQGIIVREIAAGSERVLASGITGATQPRWSPSSETLVYGMG